MKSWIRPDPQPLSFLSAWEATVIHQLKQLLEITFNLFWELHDGKNITRAVLSENITFIIITVIVAAAAAGRDDKRKKETIHAVNIP